MSKSKKHKKGKIYPGEYSEDDSVIRGEYEMDSVDDVKRNTNNRSSEKFKVMAKKSIHLSKNNALNLFTNVKAAGNKWRKYVTTRRKQKSTDGVGGIDRRRTGGIGLDTELSGDVVDGTLGNTEKQIVVAHNRNLIEYFARLGKSNDESESVNLEYVQSLLSSGAKIDCTDKYGQTIFHEIARAWHTDVAQFLIENGADINVADNFGRTPLHVASAVDYPEMCTFLIKHNANLEAKTTGEHQTPLFYAARNDACGSLKALIKAGAEYKYVRDYKGRTPLHVAAELDRSETARNLLELEDPAPAGVEDDSGQAAIVWMINKMPPVARVALDQFHTMDRANRKQYYHLHRLEPKQAGDQRDVYPQTALQCIVQTSRYDLITHDVCEKLIKVKWTKGGGKMGATINTVINTCFILLWTLQGILIEYDQRYLYILPSQWWRIFIFLLALLLTGWQIKDELKEFFNSKRNHKQWRDWREKELERDKEYAHPRWPEEEKYLVDEIDALDKQNPQYFNDFWNIFDWVCYTLLLVCIITHLVDVFNHTNFIARLHIRIMAVTIIVIWLRLMKNARAYSTLGPFIVIIAHMGGDIVKFVFLYFLFYIPYLCAFWMMFGGDKVPEEYQGRPESVNHTMTVTGIQDVNALFFSLFRLTLVDDYDYDGMKAVDSIMADILVGSWLALSAILMLNLFIALMSDTFQRVYDNAKANAVMQKAITILNIEEGMAKPRREKFRDFIHKECAPKEEFYDDDTTEPDDQDLKKVTIQIKEQLDEMQEQFYEYRVRQNQKSFGQKTRTEDLDELAQQIRENHQQQEQERERQQDEGGQLQKRRKKGAGKKAAADSDEETVTVAKFENEVDMLRDEMQLIREVQEDMLDKFTSEVTLMKVLLQQIASVMGNGQTPKARPPSPPPSQSNAANLQGYLSPSEISVNQTPVAPPVSTPWAERPALPPGYDQVDTPRSSSHRHERPNLKHRPSYVGLEPPPRDPDTDDEWQRSEEKRIRDMQQLREQMTRVSGGGRSVPDQEDSRTGSRAGTSSIEGTTPHPAHTTQHDPEVTVVGAESQGLDDTSEV